MTGDIGQSGLESPGRHFEDVGQNIFLAKINRVDPVAYDADVVTLTEGDEFLSCKIAGRIFWMPQVGDVVVVCFLEDSMSNPIILSKIMLPSDSLITTADPEGIHGSHVILDEKGQESAKFEWEFDSKGDLFIGITGTDGNMNLSIKGDAKLNISGKAHINSPKILLGAKGEHKIPFGDMLIKWLNSHTHSNGNMGLPTSSPIIPAFDSNINSQKNRTD